MSFEAKVAEAAAMIRLRELLMMAAWDEAMRRTGR